MWHSGLLPTCYPAAHPGQVVRRESISSGHWKDGVVCHRRHRVFYHTALVCKGTADWQPANGLFQTLRAAVDEELAQLLQRPVVRAAPNIAHALAFGRVHDQLTKGIRV
jgi:hypothetical protein